MAVVTFKKPVEWDGKTYASIEVDEPSLGAIEASEKATKAGETETIAAMAMVAHDSGMPLDAMRKLKASDLIKITKALEPFTEALKPASDTTGGNSAQT